MKICTDPNSQDLEKKDFQKNTVISTNENETRSNNFQISFHVSSCTSSKECPIPLKFFLQSWIKNKSDSKKKHYCNSKFYKFVVVLIPIYGTYFFPDHRSVGQEQQNCLPIFNACWKHARVSTVQSEKYVAHILNSRKNLCVQQQNWLSFKGT